MNQTDTKEDKLNQKHLESPETIDKIQTNIHTINFDQAQIGAKSGGPSVRSLFERNTWNLVGIRG